MAGGVPIWQPQPAPQFEPWTPAQETERLRVLRDMRRLDAQRAPALARLKDELRRAGLAASDVDWDFIAMRANELRAALEPFDTGEVPF